MKRYLTLILLFVNYILLSQDSKFFSINLVDKIDINSSFDITDNTVGNIIKKKLEDKGFNFSDVDSKYFIAVSFGWKYRRSTDLEIDNFKGTIIDKRNSEKVIGSFSFSKIKDLEKSLDHFINELIISNNRMGKTGKFIDVQDHFMKMNMKSWDFSRPDAHAPSGVFADHAHSKGGMMLGYRYINSKGKGNYNGNQIFDRNEIIKYYDRHVTENTVGTHSFEFMYGISNRITLFTNFNFHNKEYSYISNQNIVNSISNTGIGDIDFQVLYNLFSNYNLKFHSNIGLILPTGSIEKHFGKEKLPYNMKLGSGHFSSLAGFTAFLQLKKISAGIQPFYYLSLGDNSRGYNYGNRLSINYWAAINLNKPYSFSFRQNYIKQSSINGKDNDLVPNIMVLNNNNNSGYILFNSAFGFNLSMRKGLFKNSRISMEYVFPTYMSYEGLQIGNYKGFIINLQYSPGGHKSHHL